MRVEQLGDSHVRFVGRVSEGEGFDEVCPMKDDWNNGYDIVDEARFSSTWLLHREGDESCGIPDDIVPHACRGEARFGEAAGPSSPSRDRK